MKLNTLIRYKKARKRRGRGISAGLGKTAGRGHKGQKARAGKKLRPTFEGGQTPLFQKLPKYRGFHNLNRVEYQVVNLGQLESLKTTDITREELEKAGLVRRRQLPVKILGDGELTRAIKVAVDAASASAIEKITKAGGSFTSTAKPSAKKLKEEAVEKTA
ncbi:MAG: 50S ribosomal protein L15 [bacterium]|nr:50S ribosomal protein L15 [bacterium]